MDGVELGVEARADGAAVAIVRRRFLDQGGGQQGGQLLLPCDAPGEVAQSERFRAGQGFRDPRQRLQRAAERDELPRGREALRGPGCQSLQVTRRLQRGRERGLACGVPLELGDGSQAKLDLLDVAQRRPEPGSQAAGANRHCSTVGQPVELRQLEVPDRRRVQRHCRLGRVGADPEEAGLELDLVCPQVVEHDTGRSHREGRFLGADCGLERDAKQLAQPLAAALGVELVRVDLGRRQQLGRVEALQLALQSHRRQLAELQLAGRDVAGGQSCLATLRPGRDQEVRRRRLEVGILDHGARCQHPGDLALDQPLAGRRFDLVADHNPPPGPQQLSDVALPGVVGNPGHRVPPALAERPRGESDAHDGCGFDGVLVEELVEVAHSEEEDRAREALLGVAVLLFKVAHGCSFLSGSAPERRCRPAVSFRWRRRTRWS